MSNFGKGEIFEEFAHSFLCYVLGDKFTPVGGVKDKGVDGILRLYQRNVYPSYIYQISTESDHEGKIKDTIEKLIKNQIPINQLVYVTSRKINNISKTEDNFLIKYKIPLRIFDVEWFASNVIKKQNKKILTLVEELKEQ